MTVQASPLEDMVVSGGLHPRMLSAGACCLYMLPQRLQDPRGFGRRVRLGKLPTEVVESRCDITILWLLP